MALTKKGNTFHYLNSTRFFGFFPGMAKNRGLSFMINEQTAPTGRPPGSLAWTGLANSYFWIDRKKGVSGVTFTQVLPFADDKALALFYAFGKSVDQSLG